jgi:hypothetical protein
MQKEVRRKRDVVSGIRPVQCTYIIINLKNNVFEQAYVT